MFCSSCGKNIPEDAKFCKHCGAAAQSDSENVTTQGKLLTRMKVSSGESGGATEAQTDIGTARGKTKKRMVVAVLAVAILLAGLAVGLTLSRSKQQVVVLNTQELSIDGVHLEKGDASQHSPISEDQVVAQLNSVIGSSTVFNSTICGGSYVEPVTVAQWHDLAIFFVNGDFGGLAYDYKGWNNSGAPFSPLRPPAGARLTPLLETDGGITVGDVITRPANSPDTANSYEMLAGGGFDQFAELFLARHTGTQNFVVTGIDVLMGQC